MRYPHSLRHVRTLPALAAAALAAAVLPALTGFSQASAAISAFTSTAANQGGGNCMDDPNSSSTTGTQLIQWSCNGGATELDLHPGRRYLGLLHRDQRRVRPVRGRPRAFDR